MDTETKEVTPPLLHEWHLVGNILGCKHCRRMRDMVNPRPGDECPARLRDALDTQQQGHPMPNTITPDSYDVSLDDSCVLHVRTTGTERGDRAHVSLKVGNRLEVLIGKGNVQTAVVDIATTLEALAEGLRRMAPNLPSNTDKEPK